VKLHALELEKRGKALNGAAEGPLEARHKPKGETIMGATGKKDKGGKEQKKKPKHNLKEKRKLKNEKKNK
jgi:hypothetical protein